jgi:hypothetical protein
VVASKILYCLSITKVVCSADCLRAFSNSGCCTASLHMLHTQQNSADDLDDTKGDRGRSSGSGFASGSDGEGLGMCFLTLYYCML